MKYWLDPSTMFKSYDLLVIYQKNGKWHLYTYTSEYKLLMRDKKQLIEYCCKEKKVKPEDVRFVKWKEIVGEDI